MVEGEKQISKSLDGTVTTIKTTKTIKQSPKKIKTLTESSQRKSAAKLRENLLLENFVGLQKAMINLSIKFEGLSDNISRLLEVFELSARDQLGKSSKEEDKELLNKINSLLDQNKTIARGLVMIEEKVRDRAPIQEQGFSQGFIPPQNPPQNSPQQPQRKPLPRI
jgi:hypothetical protein